MRDEPVMICGSCGCGFLVNPGSKVHPVPAWFTSWADSGGTCGGPILMRNRHAQIIKLDLEDTQNDRASHDR